MDIKDRILEKAGELFFQYGIKNISMDELASSLGMSKSTIYENFKDKEEILRSLLIKLRNERDEAFSVYTTDKYNVVEVRVTSAKSNLSGHISIQFVIGDLTGEMVEEIMQYNQREYIVYFVQSACWGWQYTSLVHCA